MEAPNKKTTPMLRGGPMINLAHDEFISTRIQIKSDAQRSKIESFSCKVTHLRMARPIYVWHDSFMCDATHSRMIWLPPLWHDSFMYLYETWLIHMWHDSVTYDMTHSGVIWWLFHVRHDSFTSDMTPSCATWLIHVFVWDMTHLYLTWFISFWYDSLRCDITDSCVTWSIHVWHDSFVRHRLTHTVHASLQKTAHQQFLFLQLIFFCCKALDYCLLPFTFLLLCVTFFLIGLFCRYAGLFCNFTGLFCWDDKGPFEIYSATIFLLFCVTFFLDTGLHCTLYAPYMPYTPLFVDAGYG